MKFRIAMLFLALAAILAVAGCNKTDARAEAAADQVMTVPASTDSELASPAENPCGAEAANPCGEEAEKDGCACCKDKEGSSEECADKDADCVDGKCPDGHDKSECKGDCEDDEAGEADHDDDGGAEEDDDDTPADGSTAS